MRRISFEMPLPESVTAVLKTLSDASYPAYVVGGSVRDAVMGLMPNDFDIATSASPQQVTALFSATHRVIETGLKHGTVTVMCACGPVEITTFRLDGDYLDGRRPQSVTFAPALDMDLQRRDFTVNAFAYRPGEGVLDYFDGLTDIRRKVIRCIGDAEKRFSEDALRILRALRFAAKLDFDIAPETAQALVKLRLLLDKISAERICAELMKMFATPYAARLAHLLSDYRAVMTQILPETAEIADYEAVCQNTACVPAERELRLIYYIACAGNVQKTAKKLRFSNALSKRASRIAEVLLRGERVTDLHEARVLVHEYGEEACLDAAKILAAIGTNTALYPLVSEIAGRGDCVTLGQLAVGGSDLLALGIEPARIGRLLEQTLQHVMRDEWTNTRAELLKNVKNIF